MPKISFVLKSKTMKRFKKLARANKKESNALAKAVILEWIALAEEKDEEKEEEEEEDEDEDEEKEEDEEEEEDE